MKVGRQAVRLAGWQAGGQIGRQADGQRDRKVDRDEGGTFGGMTSVKMRGRAD